MASPDDAPHVQYRFASPEDAPVLASMNVALIRDQGHRNPMTLAHLTDRMSRWLQQEYNAVLFTLNEGPVGYALFRPDSEYVHLRQLFVLSTHRRIGIARAALGWLWQNAWPCAERLRIEVLVTNSDGLGFWRAVGFEEYAVTMELQRRHAV